VVKVKPYFYNSTGAIIVYSIILLSLVLLFARILWDYQKERKANKAERIRRDRDRALYAIVQEIKDLVSDDVQFVAAVLDDRRIFPRPVGEPLPRRMRRKQNRHSTTGNG